MKSIVVLAETGWSIGRVHHDVAFYLSEHYQFKFHNVYSFVIADFVRDFYAADLCLTTVGWFDHLVSMCNLPFVEDHQKMVLVCHGHCEITHQNWSPHVTFGTVSDVLLPFMPMNPYVVPNGVNSLLFEHRAHSGRIKVIGWCGNLNWYTKQQSTIFEIARQSKLAVSIAETLDFDELKEWYHSIDVLLVSSGPGPHIETGPLPPFEAIASGVAVIGTRVGNFLKVPGPKYETVEEAAQILRELKTDPEQVRRIAQDQYSWVMENWTYKTLCESWKTMFDAAAAKQTRFLDFIEVGTSGFDTEIEKKDDKVGVSIEPNKQHLDRLPNKRGCLKLNIDIISDLETLCSVMRSLNFDGVYFLKLDTKSNDAIILKKFVQEFNGDRRLLPHLIQFSKTEAFEEVLALFASLGYDLAAKTQTLELRRNLQAADKQNFTRRIVNHYIADYPANYNVRDLPHGNTLEAAKEFCAAHGCTGVTLQDGVFQVRSGKYLMPTELECQSWVFA